ncbi:hypothetical protein MKJ01_13175 [Chryseobacterium sp. SSA4.19]|uniref:hypothetical protein n=1 Tax=Chryseobacterium sp. SSA4.19 TaxID=2919915 RepID=UPI001F4D927C|nr:hypothetical protein [Chryseobacterium sp. SSA4.19]MCJ8154716.1 hypothetical protein [Chryseobacterium sp. SSA4.19]
MYRFSRKERIQQIPDDGLVITGLRKFTDKTYDEDSRKNIGLGWEIGNGFIEKNGDTFGNSSLMRY